MPAIDTEGGEPCRLERLSGRTFWILWATIILVSAAFYYEKAADNRSAFVRWRPQVLQFGSGVNIYDKMLFPNPPIMPISLYPLMVMPTVAGAMCWFAIKVAMTTAVLLMCFEIVRPAWTAVPANVALADPAAQPAADPGRLASRQQQPADLVPGGVDVLRLAKGWDIGAGLLLALATSYKVTPALFFIYFAYKRSWRTLTWGLLGLGIFLIIVPGVDHRAPVQRRVPGHVVAPHDHSVHRQERVELAGGEPVAAGGPDAAAHPPDSGTRPL